MNNESQLLKCIDHRMDSLIRKLMDWADWMRGYTPNLGSHGSTFKCVGSHDFESLFQGIEKEVMKAIDAAIDDLSPAESAAIHKRYLHIDWRFPRNNYVEMLDRAHEKLLVSLPRRNVIL